jgi:hypothetical protein
VREPEPQGNVHAAEDFLVGIEERDWYREEPSKAWKDRFRGSPSPLGSDTRQSADQPRTSPHYQSKPVSRRLRFDTWFQRYALLPLAAAAAIWFANDNRNTLSDGFTSVVAQIDPSRQTDTSPNTLPTVSNSRVVHLNSRPGLDEPARVVGKWSLNDPRFGLVSVYVPVGTTPREALTIALAERGYQVIP